MIKNYKSRRYMKHFTIDDIILMIFDGHTLSYISKHFNVSHATISNRLKEYGIKGRKIVKLCATFRDNSL